MVFKLPSARCLSKASREGALRENIANADISASSKGISTSSTSLSAIVAKSSSKRKSASAQRCLRPFGATMDIAAPNLTSSTCSRSDEGRIVAFMFTKSQLEGWRGYWDLSALRELLREACCGESMRWSRKLSQENASSGKIWMQNNVFSSDCTFCSLPPRHSSRESGRAPLSQNGVKHCRKSQLHWQKHWFANV